MGEKQNQPFQLSFNASLKVDFQGPRVASDGGLIVVRELDERQTSVVELRLFGGLSGEEAARILGVSVRTVERDWKMGQAWLRRELSTGASA